MVCKEQSVPASQSLLQWPWSTEDGLLTDGPQAFEYSGFHAFLPSNKQSQFSSHPLPLSAPHPRKGGGREEGEGGRERRGVGGKRERERERERGGKERGRGERGRGRGRGRNRSNNCIHIGKWDLMIWVILMTSQI